MKILYNGTFRPLSFCRAKNFFGPGGFLLKCLNEKDGKVKYSFLGKVYEVPSRTFNGTFERINQEETN